MKLLFSNLSAVNITLHDSPLVGVYQKIYKNLQHIDIPYRPWDSSIYYDQYSYDQLVLLLLDYARKCNVTVDKNKCTSQDYFNEIHTIYETNYNGDPVWLNFHEHIHLCERYFLKRKNLVSIDYREAAGPLEKPMLPSWINTTTKLKKGDVYTSWSELGKTPYTYWVNAEPNNITRLCELAKPWLILKPKLQIALEDVDLMENVNQIEFEPWWATYHDAWCQHWKIPEWNLAQMTGVTVLGHVDDPDLIQSNLYNNIYPVRVKL